MYIFVIRIASIHFHGFPLDLSPGGSHDVDIILRDGLLNDDACLQREEGESKTWEKIIT